MNAYTYPASLRNAIVATLEAAQIAADSVAFYDRDNPHAKRLLDIGERATAVLDAIDDAEREAVA